MRTAETETWRREQKDFMLLQPFQPHRPHPGIPTAQGEVGSLASREPGGHYGHQVIKVFVDRNDKLLINNAFVA